MPHSTTSGSYSRETSVSRSNAKPAGPEGSADSGLEKFPDLDAQPVFAGNSLRAPSPGLNGYANVTSGGLPPFADRWQPRNNNQTRGVRWGQAGVGLGIGQPAGPPSSHGRGHGKQKSISEAIRTIRGRNGSVSQNAHEIADALRAPVSGKLTVRYIALSAVCVTHLLTPIVPVDTLRHVVRVIRPHQHLVQVDPERL